VPPPKNETRSGVLVITIWSAFPRIENQRMPGSRAGTCNANKETLKRQGQIDAQFMWSLSRKPIA